MATSNDLFGNAHLIEILTPGGTYEGNNIDLMDNGIELAPGSIHDATPAVPGQEETIVNGSYYRSAWWAYVPATSGSITIDTTESEYAGPIGFAIYNENAIPTNIPNRLAGDNVVGTGTYLANGGYSTTVAVVAGHRYYIQVFVPGDDIGDSFRAVSHNYTTPQRITLKVTGPPSQLYGPIVDTDPAGETVTVGTVVSLQSTALGLPHPTLQWQSAPPAVPVGPDPWVNIDGATSSPLTFTAAIGMNHNRYRAVWTSTGGQVYSAVADLTVTEVTVGTDPTPPAVPPVEPPPFPPEPPPYPAPVPDPPPPTTPAPPRTEPGSSTVFEEIQRFSAAVGRAVRITGPGSIEICDKNAPMPAGWTQAEANSIYHTTTWAIAAGQKTLSLLAGNLALTASAALVSDDIRLLTSSWRIPDQLPVYGLRPAPIQRVNYTFTPQAFSASVEYAFSAVPLSLRRT